jgi:hypothetical protein
VLTALPGSSYQHLKGKQEKLKIPSGKTKIKMGIDYER